MARTSSRIPKTGQLEANVDAILRAQGLELNATVERVLDKSRRTRFVPAKKGQRPPAKKKARRATTRKRPPVRKAVRRRPTKGKRLRNARRKGPGKW